MNLLLEKYQDYMRLSGCTAAYELRNGVVIKVPFLETNFLHLLGIHKLTDIQIVQFWNDRSNRTVKSCDVIRAIKKETLTDSMLKSSIHFNLIEERYNHFSYDSLTTLSYTDAIIDFDAEKAHSIIKSDYLLFEQKGTGYNHLGIAVDNKSGKRYVETFFYEPSAQYIHGQVVEPIVKFTIYDISGLPIISDKFE